MAPRDLVSVGVITGAHGIRGEVKLRSFTAAPDALVRYAPLKTATGGTIEIAKLRPQKDGFIAVLKGVTDRNAAEALKGTELFVPRDRLPATRTRTKSMWQTSSACRVRAHRRHALGQIVDVANYGAGDLIDVKVEGRKDTVLIPFATGMCRRRTGRSRGRPARGLSSTWRRRSDMSFAATVLTLFPEMFPGPLGHVAGRPRAGAGHLVARRARHPRLMPPTGTGRWTIIPRAAAPAWC